MNGSNGQSRPRRGGGGGKFAKFAKPKKITIPEQPLDYKSIEYLQRFVSPQGKIWSRKRTGFSGQNQRLLALAIKRARFMGLMPYVAGRS
jgi:small subunit ribosomal protein S18